VSRNHRRALADVLCLTKLTDHLRKYPAMRAFTQTCGIALCCLVFACPANCGECMYGCCSRPACGKVCKLVCETKKLTVTCYGSDCKQICLPGRSVPGCKHCCVTCCGCGGCGPVGECCPDGCCGCQGCCGGPCGCNPCGCGPCCDSGCREELPKCEFCWRDWMPCCCGKPRTVKVLTKYEAKKEICWFHWEVVDACTCGCGCEYGTGCGYSIEGPQAALHNSAKPPCKCVYKAAPADAKIGDVIELSPAEKIELASKMPEMKQLMATPAEEQDLGTSLALASGAANNLPGGPIHFATAPATSAAQAESASSVAAATTRESNTTLWHRLKTAWRHTEQEESANVPASYTE
jgi:hypothetical protein